MPVSFTDEDRRFVEQAIARAARSRTHEELASGCERLRVIRSVGDAAGFVAGAASEHLKSGSAFSLIRIGDGEGNVLALRPQRPVPDRKRELKFFNAIFSRQDGGTLGLPEAVRLASALEEAVHGADVLGLRPLFRDPPEVEKAREALQRGEVRGALGIVRSLEFAADAARAGRLRNRTLVSAWVHLAMPPHLPDLMRAAAEIVVVSGREELRGEFSRRSAGTPVEFLAVPLEAVRSPKGGPRHYPNVYRETLARLSEPAPGRLVLVGAGLFGKVYCAAAKSAGSVALDLGSAFDVLAGLRTRPVHRQVPVDAMRWLGA